MNFDETNICLGHQLQSKIKAWISDWSKQSLIDFKKPDTLMVETDRRFLRPRNQEQ